MISFYERFKHLISEAGEARWIYSALARHVGVSRAAVKSWADGKSIPNHENQLKIADFFGVNIDWLEYGKGPKLKSSGDHIELISDKVPVIRKLNVRGTAALGTDGYYMELSEDKAGDGYIEVASLDEDAFVIRFKGQSMYPAIRDGWFGVVEPNSNIQIGEFVLVALKDGRRMVKELINKRNGHIELESVNGGTRFTVDWEDIEYAYLVSTIVSPSKFKLYI